jgi:APA family basic amino acid/polyamine antiporter
MSYDRTLVGAFTFLTTVVTAANLPLYLSCALAWFVLRARGRIVGVPVTATIGLAFVGFSFYGMGGEALVYGLGLVAFAAVLYVAMRRLDRRAATPG